MACNQGCLANVFFNSPAECLVNGQAGREYLLKDLKAPAEKQKILVIGAGPAGCDFAIRAAELGHSVTVWEKQDHLGGELDLVAVPPHKQEYRNLIKYYGAALETAGVEVITGKEAVKEDIEAEISEGADAVVIAAGTAKAKIPELPVTDGTPVYSSNEILAGRAVAGRNVLMLYLDEPTNHLDIGTLKWLEQYLKSYNGTILIVSHDRYFLDQTVNRIFEIDHKRLYIYEGNYSDYAKKRAARREEELRAFRKQQTEIDKQEEMIRRFRQHGTEKLAKRAHSREMKLQNMEKLYGITGKKEIAAFAEKTFGEYGGFAQQYLFYYIRETSACGDKHLVH